MGPSLALAGSTVEAHLHLGQKIAVYLQTFGLPDWVTLVLVSALPAIELRGGVPVGNWMGARQRNAVMGVTAVLLVVMRETFLGRLCNCSDGGFV